MKVTVLNGNSNEKNIKFENYLYEFKDRLKSNGNTFNKAFGNVIIPDMSILDITFKNLILKTIFHLEKNNIYWCR